MQKKGIAQGVFICFIVLIAQWSCTNKLQNNQETIKDLKTETPEKKELTVSRVYTTAHGTDMNLSRTGEISFGDFQQPLETEASILVNRGSLHQTFVGIGAALTDASAETFFKLDKEQQDLFMEAYYSIDKGIGYSLARTIIHSCDFSTGSYTYIEEGDAELNTFNIDHDRKYRLPFTKKGYRSCRW